MDEDENEGLLIPKIATRSELDEFEQQNIEQAIQFTLSRNFKLEVIFSEAFIKNIHKRMYNKVWKWAGDFCKTNKNIGVDKWQVAIELKNLLDDVNYWIVNETYPPDEVAVRFKHRIVSIHCFPKGNGRHSRLMADIIIEKFYKRPVFSWGGANFSTNGNIRTDYLKAIKAADKADCSLLINFARS